VGQGGTTDANEQKVFEGPGGGADFPGVDIGGKGLDGGDGVLNLFSDLRRRRQGRVAQPVMADHTFFVRVSDGASFKLRHFLERGIDPGADFVQELRREIHPADVHGEAQFRELAVVLLKPFPALLFRIVHKKETQRLLQAQPGGERGRSRT
jgi:hypothetical protein